MNFSDTKVVVSWNRRNGPRKKQGRNLMLLFQLLLLVLALNVEIIVGQSVAAVEKDEKTSVEGQLDLKSMSNEELEEICTSRGFELYKEIEEDTGNTYVFTHDDYVEAARQCLEVEREMGEILAEHPELLDELKGELDSMNSEKERLEKELAEVQKKRAEVDKIRADTNEAPPKAFLPRESDAEGTVEKETEKEATSTTGEQPKVGEPEHIMEQEEVQRVEAENVTNVDELAAENVTSVDEATETEGGIMGDDTASTDLSDDVDEKLFVEEFLEELLKPLANGKENLKKILEKIPEPVRKTSKVVVLAIFRQAKAATLKVFDLIDRFVIRTIRGKLAEKSNKEGDNKEENVGDSEETTDDALTSKERLVVKE